MSQIKAPRKPVILVIMDGMGHNPSRLNNAVRQAKTPHLDELYAHNPLTVLEASGLAVGLPPGQMGNSEVGHTTLGAGMIVRQDLVRIDEEIASGAFHKNFKLLNAMQRAKAKNRPIHLLGLVSDGGIHAHIRHLEALIRMAEFEGVQPLVHMISDGRDCPPTSSIEYVRAITPALKDANGAIASICGRFYAMDRDNRWHRIEKAFRLITEGVGVAATDAETAIKDSWSNNVFDEFIQPIRLPEFECIQNQDEVIFFNFRSDRPRELTSALISPEFNAFSRAEFLSANVTSMTLYDERFQIPIAFEKEKVRIPIAKAIADKGIAQFHVAETEKYPHVTFFFNGGQEEPFSGEVRHLVPSPNVETYDTQPQMSATEVTAAAIEAIHANKYGFIIINFANGDMVGHTGDFKAAIKAVETVDTCVGAVLQEALEKEYSVVVTADHGNCDVMVDPIKGTPHTQHTTFPVACAIVDFEHTKLANGYGLSSVAPTILQLMGLEIPTDMSGNSLLLH